MLTQHPVTTSTKSYQSPALQIDNFYLKKKRKEKRIRYKTWKGK